MFRKITTEWKGGMTFESDDPGGKTVIMDTEVEGSDDRFGISPKAAMLSALASCSGIDVVSILEKMKVPDYGFKMDVEGELTQEHPKYFHRVKIDYHFTG
jgi:putative redox protein